MKYPFVLFIVGPTASWKSELAIALAKRLGGEVISADSMLVYKGMDIGTAKLSKKERRGIPHHGMDLIPPTKKFSVFTYHQFALKKIKEVIAHGKVPIVAGGTGFYIRALLEGFFQQPAADPRIRRKLEQEAHSQGLPALYARLRKIDPKRATAIGSHNPRRIIRALEIYELSEEKPSKSVRKIPGLKSLDYSTLVIGLNRDRAALYQRINKRVDRMFRRGLVGEVKRLAQKGFSQTALQGVGYKEVLSEIQSGLKRSDWTQVKEKIKQGTRHFAKRQWTWFKREKGIRWVWWPEQATLTSVRNFITNHFKLCERFQPPKG